MRRAKDVCRVSPQKPLQILAGFELAVIGKVQVGGRDSSPFDWNEKS
jgi:hypothetical protein